MIRLLGVGGLLIILYAVLFATSPGATDGPGLIAIANTTGLYGLMTVGVALVIITGGIDLSVGSVVALSAINFLVFVEQGIAPPLAAIMVLLIGALIGLSHGLLVTRVGLQPFLVTLCGLFVYRGLSRIISPDDIGRDGVANRMPQYEDSFDTMDFLLVGHNAKGLLVFPGQFVLLLIVIGIIGYLLHKSTYGRYLYAIGHNEQGARYAGIPTGWYKVSAYVISSTLVSLAGILFTLDTPSVSSANSGSYYELYAITGAVLGGCSLRGGEGMVIGMLLGAAVLPVLEKVVVSAGVPDNAKYLAFGLALLFGTIADQFFRKRSLSRK